MDTRYLIFLQGEKGLYSIDNKNKVCFPHRNCKTIKLGLNCVTTEKECKNYDFVSGHPVDNFDLPKVLKEGILKVSELSSLFSLYNQFYWQDDNDSIITCINGKREVILECGGIRLNTAKASFVREIIASGESEKLLQSKVAYKFLCDITSSSSSISEEEAIQKVIYITSEYGFNTTKYFLSDNNKILFVERTYSVNPVIYTYHNDKFELFSEFNLFSSTPIREITDKLIDLYKEKHLICRTLFFYESSKKFIIHKLSYGGSFIEVKLLPATVYSEEVYQSCKAELDESWADYERFKNSFKKYLTKNSICDFTKAMNLLGIQLDRH